MGSQLSVPRPKRASSNPLHGMVRLASPVVVILAASTTQPSMAAFLDSASKTVVVIQNKTSTAVFDTASQVRAYLQEEIATAPGDIRQGLEGNITFLPSADEISEVQARQRRHFWALNFATSYVAVVILGTGIMRKWTFRCFAKTDHERLVDVETEHADEGHEGFNGLSFPNVQLFVVGLFAGNYAADLAICVWSLCKGKLSPSTGLDFELYYVHFGMTAVSLVVQSTVAVRRLPKNAEFGDGTFAEATVFGMMPLLSDGFDTLKDMIFGALCVQSDHTLLKFLGISSWVYLLGVHVRLFFNYDCIMEMAGSYLPVLLAPPKKTHGDELQAQTEELQAQTTLDFWQQKVWPKLYKQSTPAKQKMILEENAFQAVAAGIYLSFTTGASFVAMLNLGLPIAQYSFAYAFHRPLLKRATPWLGQQLLESVEVQNFAKTNDICRAFGLNCVEDQEGLIRSFASNLVEGRGKGAGDALAEGLKANTTLKKLYLRNNQIVHIDVLGEGLKGNTTLKIIDLCFNQIVHIDALAEGLKANTTLKELDLHDNQIVRIDAFAEGLKGNTALETLNLSGNQIVHIDALGEALKANTTLEKLDLNGNQIVHIDALGEGLKGNTALKELNLRSNQIVRIDAFAEGLKGNTALESLDLSRNQIVRIDAFAEGLKGNTRLSELNLDDNPFADSAAAESLSMAYIKPQYD
eukprot:TRINITY_DN8122_c0_g1_i13.p1 TRINITY_DN8122_c0_g1~~TRINITY_DN8122_c0_g1_i13.p1  ORF type:complete len:694 (+),score=164.46 TRINITY_DN8122_c0_g1_i13:79-2160(+)